MQLIVPTFRVQFLGTVSIGWGSTSWYIARMTYFRSCNLIRLACRILIIWHLIFVKRSEVVTVVDGDGKFFHVFADSGTLGCILVPIFPDFPLLLMLGFPGQGFVNETNSKGLTISIDDPLRVILKEFFS